MITQEPTEEMIHQWKTTWLQYKDKLHPNRKSGVELLNYLQGKYVLTEIFEKKAADCVVCNVMMNPCYREKLEDDAIPIPRTFFLENIENGKVFYSLENKDCSTVWGENISRIFVGIDLSSGFYMVEGSTMLWDELNAFQGLDEKDLQNFVCVAQYIDALKRFNLACGL